MPPKNITVTIADVDEQTDSMRVYAAGTGYPISISRFKGLVADSAKHGISSEHLLRNVAIHAALANADPDDINSIKAAVEGVPFKV